MTEHAATRVVLLARAGEARARLGEALSAAGADLVLVADPLSAAPADVAAANPQAVLVALEPAIEDALEHFDEVLSDPAVAVIFDDADLAAQRTGWDAARWARHLVAKLNNHDDVLPPGAEAEGEWQPSPGPLPSSIDAAALNLAPFKDEAQLHAGQVPRDEGLLQVDSVAIDSSEASIDADSIDIDSVAAPDAWQALDAEPAENIDADIAAMLDDENFSYDLTASAHAAEDGKPDQQAVDHSLLLEDADTPASSTTATTPAPVDFDLSGLSLLDPGAVPASDTAASRAAASEHDLEALEQRVAGLSLADADSYGHGPLRGAVLVDGGLGGPDAVRQLLAGIGEGFPRPILVRLQLDGGRYDRLVAQMERAAQLPVSLAEAGQGIDAGTIYFLTPQLGVQRKGARLQFVEHDGDAHAFLSALPADDSAYLFLSGSTVGFAEAAAGLAAEGALVACQSPDSCYDADAPSALIALGATSGTPAELVEQLAERWPY